MLNTSCLSLKNLTILIYFHYIQLLITDAIIRNKHYNYTFFNFYRIKEAVRFNGYYNFVMNFC